jgi:hypothetical protein
MLNLRIVKAERRAPLTRGARNPTSLHAARYTQRLREAFRSRIDPQATRKITAFEFPRTGRYNEREPGASLSPLLSQFAFNKGLNPCDVTVCGKGSGSPDPIYQLSPPS